MSHHDRIAVVAGLRTPFTKAGTLLRTMRTVDLATTVVKELVRRSEIAPKEIGLVVYGQVVPTLDWINIAREVVLQSGLPKDIDAYSVSRACATSIQAMTDAAQALILGQHDVAIAGGADSMSDVPLGASKALGRALSEAQKAKSFGAKLKAFAKLSAKDRMPKAADFLREATTHELMGEAAEKMAKLNGITRQAQDEIAHRSHAKAARAWSDGTFAAEVMHVVPPSFDAVVDRDNLVRADSTVEGLASLAPIFDRRHGTITAGNASAFTDGASALLLMTEAKARALGHAPLGFVKSWAYAAVDPGWQLAMGPVFAAPKALDRAGLTLAQMDLVDMHEAFAAQIASNVEALASKSFAMQKLNRKEAIGDIDPAKLNVNGGSIALGHPLAATGGRMVLSTLRELEKRGGQYALITVCAAGGLGAAVVLEAA